MAADISDNEATTIPLLSSKATGDTTFPIEIWIKIIGYLQHQPVSLSRFARTNKTLNTVACEILYHSVDTGLVKWCAAQDAIASTTKTYTQPIFQNIHSLKIVPTPLKDEYAWSKSFEDCSRLTKLDVVLIPNKRTPCRLQSNLTTLSLHFHPDGFDWAAIWTLLSSSIAIKHLSLNHVGYRMVGRLLPWLSEMTLTSFKVNLTCWNDAEYGLNDVLRAITTRSSDSLVSLSIFSDCTACSLSTMDAHHISRLTNLQMLELEGLIVPPPLNGIKRELKCLILRNVSRLHPSIIKEFTVNSNLTTLVFTQASADYTALSGSLLHIKYLGIAIYPQTVNQVTKFLQSNGAHIESLELHYGHDAPSMMQRMSSLPSLKKLIIYDKSSINERLSDIIAWRHVAMMKLEEVVVRRGRVVFFELIAACDEFLKVVIADEDGNAWEHSKEFGGKKPLVLNLDSISIQRELIAGCDGDSTRSKVNRLLRGVYALSWDTKIVIV